MSLITIAKPENLQTRIDARIAQIDSALTDLNTGTMTVAKAKTALVAALEGEKDILGLANRIINRLTSG